MKNRENKKLGFTLVELLVVVAIIAALVGIMVPTFGANVEKARETADIASLRAAYADASARYFLEPLASNTVTVSGVVLSSSGALEHADASGLPFQLPVGFDFVKGKYAVTFDFLPDVPTVTISAED